MAESASNGLVTYDSSEEEEEEDDADIDANTRQNRSDTKDGHSSSNGASLPPASEALSKLGTESTIAAPQSEHYDDIYKRHNEIIQKRMAVKRRHQPDQSEEEEIHPADTIASSTSTGRQANNQATNSHGSNTKQGPASTKQRRVAAVPEAAQQASIASAYTYRSEEQGKEAAKQTKEPSSNPTKGSLAKERVKNQRLKGQSGIGEDFKTWRSEEEMRLRQHFD